MLRNLRKIHDTLILRDFLHTISHFIKALCRFTLKKIDVICKTNIYQFCYYPSCLRNVLKEKNVPNYENGYLGKLERIISQESSCEHKNITPTKIRLASLEITCDGLPDWFQTFDDNENLFSLHRWGWLLIMAVDNPSTEIKEWGMRVMGNWFLKMNNRKDHHAWESYSVSERIVNASLFLYVLRDFPCNQNNEKRFLEKRLMSMAVYLKNHLEFHGEKTNNHVLNNARALYMLGRFSSCEELTRIGRCIFIEETPKMITTSGFLREESSSYHLLLLRTYIETLWIAEYTEDTEFVEKIKPIVVLMVKASWIFYIYEAGKQDYNIPIIGDITPDFPLYWLKNVCVSRLALALYQPDVYQSVPDYGWNKIWAGDDSQTKQLKNEHLIKKSNYSFTSRYQSYNESGWHRLDNGNITIIWFVNPNGNMRFHGHNDIFSFVLYWKGCEVISDIGRLNYRSEDMGLYGKGARAHNTYIIDGLGPFLIKRFFPLNCRNNAITTDYESGKETFSFKITYNRFGGKGCNLLISREFCIAEERLSVRDYITGTGRHEVQTFFHLGVDVHPEEYRENNVSLKVGKKEHAMTLAIENEDATVEIVSGRQFPEPVGWNFPEYGKSLAANTIVITKDIEFPYKAEYVFDFVNI